MEYVQQKTPFIERWEKAMEEMLKKGGGDPSTEADQLFQRKDGPLSPQLTHQSPREKENEREKEEKERVEGEKEKEIDKETERDKERESKVEVGHDLELESKDPLRKRKGEELIEEQNLRKNLHNATEKRRRENINTRLEDLKQLIPHCKNTATQKAAILSQAIDYIKTLVSSYNEQVELNKKLQETNRQLHAELKELHQSVWQRDKIFLSNLQQFRGY
eukprot:TRINITY_DN3439_c0_g2_i12.p1 TRINITY_DN3439_c0_g2~~TRINITY_DN3439_c0_g2_i12.p1  ORF type:complete len:219 (+),score=82.05 TRINITY_DN3439_c0_g2_i12:126-782(+)